MGDDGNVNPKWFFAVYCAQHEPQQRRAFPPTCLTSLASERGANKSGHVNEFPAKGIDADHDTSECIATNFFTSFPSNPSQAIMGHRRGPASDGMRASPPKHVLSAPHSVGTMMSPKKAAVGVTIRIEFSAYWIDQNAARLQAKVVSSVAPQQFSTAFELFLLFICSFHLTECFLATLQRTEQDGVVNVCCRTGYQI